MVELFIIKISQQQMYFIYNCSCLFGLKSFYLNDDHWEEREGGKERERERENASKGSLFDATEQPNKTILIKNVERPRKLKNNENEK